MSPHPIAAPADHHLQGVHGPRQPASAARPSQAWCLAFRSASTCLMLAFALSADAAQSLYFGDPGGTIGIPAPAIPAEADQLTIECRIKILTPPTRETLLLSQWKDLDGDVDKTNAPDQGRFYLGLSPTGQVVVGLRSAQGTVDTLTGKGSRLAAGWHHLVATWQQGAVVLYVDGVAVANKTFARSTALAASALPLVVGHAEGLKETGKKTRKKEVHDELPVFFEGFIADVALWSTARDAATVAQALRQPLSGSEAGLIAYYPLHRTTPGATPSPVVTGLPSGVPDGRINGPLPLVGWCDTPHWSDPAPDRPWVHFSRHSLSAVPRPVKDGATGTLPALKNTAQRRLVANQQTRQAGVLWQDRASRQVYVTWVDNDLTGLRCAPLPTLEKADLITATSGPAGNLYYLMVESVPGNHPETIVPKGILRMVDASGQSVHQTPLDMGPRGFSWYSGGWRCNMAYANGWVSMILPRTMYNGDPTGKSAHHQASVTAAYSADLAKLSFSGNPSSHSFGTILSSASSSEAMGLELGDVFPRALQLHKFVDGKRFSKIIFNYKAHLITIEKDGRPLKVSHDAETYTELGGVAEGEVSYSVIFATDRSPAGLVLDYGRVGLKGESRNLAMLRVVKDFETIDSHYTVKDSMMVPGIPIPEPPETGEFHVFTGQHCRQRNTGLIWLTDYGQGEAARAPHIVRRRDGNILVIWEKTGGSDGGSLWAMVVHESGQKLIEPVRLGVDLELDREDPVIGIGNRAYFLARERKTNEIVLCSVLEEVATGGRPDWGPGSPAYQAAYRAHTTASLKKRLDAIDLISDHAERLESLNGFLALDSLGAADPALVKEAKERIARLLKDPVLRKEQEAELKYQRIRQAEQKAGQDQNPNRKKDTLIQVALAYREIAKAFKETRAGRKAAADFERLKDTL